MAPSRARSIGPSQMKRNISSPLVIGSLAAREQKEKTKRWLTRVGIVICICILLPLVVYLSISISRLRSAMQDATHDQEQLISQLLTMKHTNIRRDVGKVSSTSELKPKEKKTLVLNTKVGEIRIVLRPDLSRHSVEYIENTIKTGCKRCNLYRAEKPGVLQGAIEDEASATSLIPRGECPEGYDSIRNVCPEYDASCACHGPLMTRGMVAWAAGQTGPDFFINDYAQRATWWGTTHTCFGEIQDISSFDVIEEIWKLPTHKTEGGLTHLDEMLNFVMRLEIL